ncbi:MAG TPA: trehalose-phosphatase [Vicinamibacterales bacterium]|nr:trehalose-phosphatase [Vicinamibacterales bacterium]
MRPNALDAWPDLVPRLARFRRLAVFVDFDGTLAPIRARASAVRLSRRARRVLAALAARGHVVGIISGRAINDLRRRVGLTGLWYVGDHGFLLESPRGRRLQLVRHRERAAVVRATRTLRASLRGVSGVTIEPKDAGVAVHYRNAPAPSRLVAARVARQLGRAANGLRVMAGKCVWELVPIGTVDKALAVRLILQSERRRRGGALLPIYIGDDTADERVFSTQARVSIAVGPRPSAAARYRLRSPAEVCRWLERLATLDPPGAPTARRASAARRRTPRG